MIRPLMVMMRAVSDTMEDETKKLTPAQTINAPIVQKRQARKLLKMYPSAPSESGFNHQATAIPYINICSRAERVVAPLLKNQMTGSDTKRVISNPTSQPTPP